MVVSLGDDPDGVFQSAPPSPVDLAVVFSNLQRLGVKRAASAAVLAWDAPDVIGLAALDKVLGRFDSMLMAAPLTRGAVPEPMPAAFRRASLPLDAIHGDSSALPAVNRIPIPNVIFGGENTWAGFQTLESEPVAGFHPLLARWGDRVVFSFPLLAAMQRLGLPLDGMEIRPGDILKLGAQGPSVPLDRFGRLAMRVKAVPPHDTIAAETVIDAGPGLFPTPTPGPVILRDDRSGAEPATRAFSTMLPVLAATLATDAGWSPAEAFPRPAPAVETAILLVLSAVLAWAGGFGGFARAVLLLTISGAVIAVQCIAAGLATLWLPGLAALAAVGVAAVVPWIPSASKAPARSPALPRPASAKTPPTPTSSAKPPGKSAPKQARKRGKKRRR